MAQRLVTVTGYLADLTQQYGDHPGLAMVSDVLRQLSHDHHHVASAAPVRRTIPTPSTDAAYALGTSSWWCRRTAPGETRVTDDLAHDGVARRKLLRTAGAVGVAAVGATALAARPAAAADFHGGTASGRSVRVYDTHGGEGRMSANQQRTLVGGTMPDDIAHLYNVTVTETAGSAGFLAVFPGDIAWPGTSSINWFGPGQTLANNAYTMLALGDQAIRLRTGGPAGSSTHVLLDLVGVLTVIDLDSAGVASALTALAGGGDGRDRRLRSVASD